jgi:hypothetical protein
MNDWLHNLPIVWMALLVFGLTALGTAAIYVVVMALSVGERARSFKAVSPGLLPPLGILFALFIAFTASQVWTDNDRANSVVDREASALRAVVILAAAFPGEPEMRLRGLIRSYVADAVAQEWPMMARRTATLQMIPYSLAEALQLTLALTPSSQGQQTAQREIATALENALDARRRASSSVKRKSIGSNGYVYACRQSAHCSRSRWSIATVGSRLPSQWGFSRLEWPHPCF